MPKVSGLPTSSTAQLTDYLPLLQIASSTDVRVTLQTLAGTLMSQFYPIGAIYTETTGTNPGTTFGFGTWTQVAQGQTLVGQLSSDTDFATAGSTGGEKNHVLVQAEMPSHNHGVNDPGHTHNITNGVYNTGTSTLHLPTAGVNAVSFGVGTTSSATGISLNSAGSDQAHNNMPPYLVVYFWKRTA